VRSIAAKKANAPGSPTAGQMLDSRTTGQSSARTTLPADGLTLIAAANREK